MWKTAVVVLVGIPAAYLLYTLLVVLRLVIEAWRLKRACAPRRLAVEWALFWMFPDDIEDPAVLTVTLRKGERRFSFTVFRSSISDYRFTRVTVEPIALCEHLRGRVSVETKDTKYGTIYMPDDQTAVHTFGIEELDARYDLREDTRKDAPNNIALLCSAFARPDVRAALSAFGGSVGFEYGHLAVAPGAREKPFLDAIEQVAHLADALDDVVKVTGPYR